MSDLIKDPKDSRRAHPADVLQFTQNNIYSVQRLFADSTLAFKALRLAWESVRLAWYAVTDETDGDHLDDVRTALRAVESHVEGGR